MGDIFILIFKAITIVNSILMIIHCLFHPNLGKFEYMFIVIILLLAGFMDSMAGRKDVKSFNKGVKA